MVLLFISNITYIFKIYILYFYLIELIKIKFHLNINLFFYENIFF